MIPFIRTFNLLLFIFLSLLTISSCSEPEAKPIFKFSESAGDGETITIVTNSDGKIVLSFPMKTEFTSTFKYNKFNRQQVDGIEGEGYVTSESGKQILIDTYFSFDVYEEPEYQKESTKEGVELGINGAVRIWDGRIYATEEFTTALPIRVYYFDGEKVTQLYSNDATGEYRKFPHTSRLNMVYTDGIDTLLIFPSKMIEDSTGKRDVGFTSIKLDGVHEILPYIEDLNSKEKIIYDKIPSFAKNDFDYLVGRKEYYMRTER